MLLFLAALFCGVCFSFKNYNPCDFASNNITFIKEQTENAVSASELQMAKYYAYKALDGIWNAQYSFDKCGCDDAIVNIELASKNLKEATKSGSLEDSKTFLQIAMRNARNSMNAIVEFESSYSKYGYESLSKNTKKDVSDLKAEISLDNNSLEKMEARLAQYEKSITNVIQMNDCLRAQEFIAETQKITKTELSNPLLSLRKQYYHHRVIEITEAALRKLENCGKGTYLLARK